MSELTWRKEPPDKPGWWWIKMESEQTRRPIEIAQAYYCGDELYIGHPGDAFRVSFLADRDWLWAGPIEPPKQ